MRGGRFFNERRLHGDVSVPTSIKAAAVVETGLRQCLVLLEELALLLSLCRSSRLSLPLDRLCSLSLEDERR